MLYVKYTCINKVYRQRIVWNIYVDSVAGSHGKDFWLYNDGGMLKILNNSTNYNTTLSFLESFKRLNRIFEKRITISLQSLFKVPMPEMSDLLLFEIFTLCLCMTYEKVIYLAKGFFLNAFYYANTVFFQNMKEY